MDIAVAASGRVATPTPQTVLRRLRREAAGSVAVGALGLMLRGTARAPGSAAVSTLHDTADQGLVPFTFLHTWADALDGMPDALLRLGPLRAHVLGPFVLVAVAATFLLLVHLTNGFAMTSDLDPVIVRTLAVSAAAVAAPTALAVVVGIGTLLVCVVLAVVVWAVQIALGILCAIMLPVAVLLFAAFWFAPQLAAVTGIAHNLAKIAYDEG